MQENENTRKKKQSTDTDYTDEIVQNLYWTRWKQIEERINNNWMIVLCTETIIEI